VAGQERQVSPENAFLVEHYCPGLTVDELGALAARVREAAAELEREGKPVRYLRADVVPADESLLCLFEAGSEEAVRQTYARAGTRFDRITAVIQAALSCIFMHAIIGKV
jgi:hypothetical protein